MKAGEYAIAGLGVVPPGVYAGGSTREMTRLAVERALADAGLRAQDVGGYLHWPGQGTGDVRYIGLSPNFIWAMEAGGATPIAMVSAACGAIESGLASAVVVAGTIRWRSQQKKTGNVAYGVGQLWGLFSPIANHALLARHYMDRYGVSEEQLGMVAVTQREYACLRPEAMEYGKPITMDDYLNSRYVCEPFRLLDCTRDCDVAMAVVVTRSERARDLRTPVVTIEGVGFGEGVRLWRQRRLYEEYFDFGPARESAFGMAGITTADVDVFQCYDAFSANVFLYLEGYGFCGKGEAPAFVGSGETRLGGKLPTNTGGGQLSGWYLTGFTPLTEGIRQLRGEGGASQVAGAQIALVGAHGGNSGMQNTYHHGCLVLARGDR